MKVEEKGHTIIIKDTQGDLPSFVDKVRTEYTTFKNHNLILDISSDTGLSIDDVLSFMPLASSHRAAKKSLVIVANDIDFNDVPDEMTVVPTVLEAHDIIEMEEIERDLGF